MEGYGPQPNKSILMEYFKPIPGYENYTISNLSRVTGVQAPFLSQCKNSSGYLMVQLCKNGNKKTFQIHQLMAITFLDHKPNGKRYIHVDHIDNDKLNNKLENIQIISGRENVTKEKRGRSKYTGVAWHKGNKKWQAQFWDGKYEHLGYFKTEIEASNAYQKRLEKWKNI